MPYSAVIFNMKNLKNAFISVIKGAGDYIGIYAAVAAVQIVFAVFSVTAVSSVAANDRTFREAYDYDIVVRGDSEEIYSLYNYMKTESLADDSLSFTDFNLTDTDDTTSELSVSVKKGRMNSFLRYYADKYAPRAEYEIAPGYLYFDSVRPGNIAVFILYGCLLFAVSVLILSVMYNLRLSHHKFKYGIFMTCGANFKMLYRTAFSECFAVSVLTFVPCVLISLGLCALVCIPGVLYVNVVTAAVFVILYAAALSLAVFVPVKRMSVKSPISLLRSEDNNGLVSSPRFSCRIFGKKYPLFYELLSMWRFRKYFAVLTASAVCFSVLFITGMYAADIVKTQSESECREVVLTPANEVGSEEERLEYFEDAEYFVPSLLAVDGVESLRWEISERLTSQLDHLLLSPDMPLSASEYTIACAQEREGYTRATNYARYVALNPLTLKMYEQSYKVDYLEGYDADNILSAENTVVLSEAFNLEDRFGFEPGDKIVIAQCIGGDTDSIRVTDDRLDILSMQVRNLDFRFYEYTVGAVIRGVGADDSIIVGLDWEDYQTFTDVLPVMDEISVYVSSDIGIERLDSLREQFDDKLRYFENWNITFTDEAVYKIAGRTISFPGMIYVITAAVTVIYPFLMILSRTVFCRKRKREFAALTAMGASKTQIRSQFLISGAVLSVFVFLVTLFLSSALCYGIYRLFGVVLPLFGITNISTLSDRHMLSISAVACAAVSAVCALLSGIIPYVIYKRDVKKDNGILSDELK